MAVPAHRFLLLVLVALVVGGCAAREEAADAASPEAQCLAALRDLRTWCTEGLRDRTPERKYNCLEARLRYDRLCLGQRE